MNLWVPYVNAVYAGFEALYPHDIGHRVFRAPYPLFAQGLMNTGTSVSAFAILKDFIDEYCQMASSSALSAFRPVTPLIITAFRYTVKPA